MNWTGTNTEKFFCRVNSRSYTDPNTIAHPHPRGTGYNFNILKIKAQRRIHNFNTLPYEGRRNHCLPLRWWSKTRRGEGKGEGELSRTHVPFICSPGHLTLCFHFMAKNVKLKMFRHFFIIDCCNLMSYVWHAGLDPASSDFWPHRTPDVTGFRVRPGMTEKTQKTYFEIGFSVF